MTEKKDNKEKASAIKKVDIKQDNAPLKDKSNNPKPNIALRILLLLLLFLAGGVATIYFLPVISERIPMVANWVGQSGTADLDSINQKIEAQQQTINQLTQKANQQQRQLAELAIPDLSTLENRMMALEEQLNISSSIEEESAPSVDTSQAARIDMLLSRMSQLEASFVPLSKNMLDAAEAEKERATLQSETSDLSDKMEALESRLASLETQAAKDNSGLLINMKIAELKRKVIAGDNYSVELASVKRLIESSSLAMNGNVNRAIDQLSKNAASGLPTPGELKNKFNALIPELMATPVTTETTSWWQSTVTRFQNMITVRRTDEVDGNDGSLDGMIAEIESWLDSQEVAAILDIINTMPAALQNLLSDWKMDLETWLYGEEAIETLESVAAESYLVMTPTMTDEVVA